MSVTIDKRITELLKYQLPGFIRENHQNFTTFMEAYYEWMESRIQKKDSPLYGTVKLLDYNDIDKTLDDYLEYFVKEFLVHFPKNILCDKRKLIKNVIQFYKTRGNEKSFKFLFKILFSDKISFYYPTVDLLRPDAGLWVEDKSIRCKFAFNATLFDVKKTFLNKRIIGNSSQAIGLVDNVIEYDLKSHKVYELFFAKNSIQGNFSPNERVSVKLGSSQYLMIIPILTKIEITDPGMYYTLKDRLTVTHPIYDVIMTAVIKKVDEEGRIEYIDVTNASFGYPAYPTTAETEPRVTFAGNQTAKAKAIIGALWERPGHYVLAESTLDGYEKLRDDWYYQEFSYEITTHYNFVEWIDIIKQLVHPAGMLPFCNLLIEPDLTSLRIRCVDFLLSIIPSDENNGIIDVPDVINPYSTTTEINLILAQKDVKNTTLGASMRSLSRDAFKSRPTQLFGFQKNLVPGPDNLETEDGSSFIGEDSSSDPIYMKADQWNYWDSYAHYSLVDLADVSLDKMHNDPSWRTTIQPVSSIVTGQYLMGKATLGAADGPGIRNVGMFLTGDEDDVVATNDFGEYFFQGIVPGNYKITPSLLGYAFSPLFRSVVVEDEIIDGLDFIAQVSLKISGTVTEKGLPLEGVTVDLNGPVILSTVTNEFGEYSFEELLSGEYTITPTMIDHIFDPLSKNVTVVDVSIISVDFQTLAFPVSGTILLDSGSPAVDVEVLLNGIGGNYSVQTNESGQYQFDYIEPGDYTITPLPPSAAIILSPTETNITVIDAPIVGMDFVAYVSYELSGTISESGVGGIEGVAVDLVGSNALGPVSASTTTDISGYYSFSVFGGSFPFIASGDYTITPSLLNYEFTPAERDVTVAHNNVTNINFDAEYLLKSISGTIQWTGHLLEGVLVDGGLLGTQTTNINGEYTFNNILKGTAYTLTPSKAGYTFEPTDSSGILEDNITVDFVSHLLYSISGVVEEDNLVAPGVTVKLVDLNLDLTAFNGLVNPVIKDGNYLYVGGQFTSYKGTSCNRIAKIDITTGELVPAFVTGSGFSGGGNDTRALVLNGNDLYVGGHFTDYNTTTRQAIAKINATTGAVDLTFDSAFGCGGPSPVVNSILLSSGSLYLSGAMTTYKGVNRTRYCKIDATTAALDVTFNTSVGFNGSTTWTQINDAGTAVYICGDFTTCNGSTRQHVVKVDAATAAVDGVFNTTVGFNDNCRTMILNGNDLYINGRFTSYKGTTRQRIAKINATDASLDATFDTSSGFDNETRHFQLVNNYLYVGGSFTTYKGTTRQRMAKIDATTASLDAAFDTSSGFDNLTLGFVVDQDAVYVGGNFASYDTILRQYITKINATNAQIEPFTYITQITDSDGFYCFDILDNSSYRVEAIVTDYVYTPQYIDVIILDNYAENVDFN